VRISKRGEFSWAEQSERRWFICSSEAMSDKDRAITISNTSTPEQLGHEAIAHSCARVRL
jgi:hypothetical protein